tara:strand:- start:101 stop:280 length:180 start_codon:yes stop_codon:yes gene_type:complete
MRKGDMVRFWKYSGDGPFVGLLVEYNTWEKVARIFHEGELISIRAEHTQKAGKKDAKNT